MEVASFWLWFIARAFSPAYRWLAKITMAAPGPVGAGLFAPPRSFAQNEL
jgi:hypothetical protein